MQLHWKNKRYNQSMGCIFYQRSCPGSIGEAFAALLQLTVPHRCVTNVRLVVAYKYKQCSEMPNHFNTLLRRHHQLWKLHTAQHRHVGISTSSYTAMLYFQWDRWPLVQIELTKSDITIQKQSLMFLKSVNLSYNFVEDLLDSIWQQDLSWIVLLPFEIHFQTLFSSHNLSSE